HINTEELVQGLRLQWAKNKKHVNNGYRLEKQMRYSRTKKMPLEFTAADRIYFDESINLAACMKENFQDELESLDFRTKAEEEHMEINNWIANVIRNEIPEMLNLCDVTSDSQMVLANAAYFKVVEANSEDEPNSIVPDTEILSYVDETTMSTFCEENSINEVPPRKKAKTIK
ncbi:serine protease inhibitor 88Ea-like, partial [Musca vetustissima]|uniref:serine protease inhibitor 88Ea-like n=1 Tax=Musca vetustissima TaxID=27455 RepID=UPI002AB650BE